MDKKLGINSIRGYQLQRIPFVPARNPDAHSVTPSQLGFVCLNEQQKPEDDMGRGSAAQPPKAKPRSQELFRLEDVPMQHKEARRLGTGFRNLGNTCFMNSVLQCLLHTPPLAELLLSNKALAAKSNAQNNFDPIAMTRRLLHDSVMKKRNYVSPDDHARTLRRVSRSFRFGRQEDAHEYLIAFLDAMHERAIAGIIPKPPQEIEFTSFIYRIFGGRIRSQVKCTQCGYESNTYDPFLDLSLEINHASSVKAALKRFTQGEVLDGQNKYKCPKENRGVRAIKRMTIEDAPPVLVVQLKRFEFSLSGRKISKEVQFDPVLDLSTYLSHRPNTPELYDLYGLLVHQGHSMHSGHYFCYVKGGGNGGWHKFDDTRVASTGERNVLGQQAYILFYIKKSRATPVVAGPSTKKAAAAAREKENTVQNKVLPSPPASPTPAIENKKKKNAKRKLVVEEAAPAAAPNSKKKQKSAAANETKNAKKKSKGALEDGSTGEDSQAGQFVRSIKGKKQQPERELDDDDDDDDGLVHRPRSRTAVIPTSPIIMNRRNKRFVEQQFLAANHAISNRNKAGSPAPPKRKRLAALAEKEEKKQQRAGKRKSLKSSGEDRSLGSAVSAPDWPPMKPDAEDNTDTDAGTARRPAKRAKTGAGRKADAKQVQNFLKSGTAATLGLDSWEETEAAEKKKHDRLMRKAAPARRQVDEYDLEYDKGKTKKVRVKDQAGEKLDSKAFDSAFKSKKQNGVQVQLRGKKKKAAERGGNFQQRGRGRGRGRGGGGRRQY